MIASFSIAPMDVGEELKEHIAELVPILERSGVDFLMGAMQTIVEGDSEEVISVIMACHHHIRAKASRVLTHITLEAFSADTRGPRTRTRCGNHRLDGWAHHGHSGGSDFSGTWTPAGFDGMVHCSYWSKRYCRNRCCPPVYDLYPAAAADMPGTRCPNNCDLHFRGRRPACATWSRPSTRPR